MAYGVRAYGNRAYGDSTLGGAQQIGAGNYTKFWWGYLGTYRLVKNVYVRHPISGLWVTPVSLKWFDVNAQQWKAMV